MPELSKSFRFHDDEALALFLRERPGEKGLKTVFSHYRSLLLVHYVESGKLSKKRVADSYTRLWAIVIAFIKSEEKKVPFRSPLLLDFFYLFDIINSSKVRFPPTDEWDQEQQYAAKKILVSMLPEFENVKKAIYLAFQDPTRHSLPSDLDASFFENYFLDIYQDAQLALYANPPKDEGGQEAKLFTYFKKIFWLKTIDKYFRKTKKQLEVDLEEEIETFISDPDVHKNASFIDYVMEYELNRDEDPRRYLQQKLEALDEICRQVLLMRYRDGYSYKEIAEELGIPEHSVGQKIKTCRKRLAKTLN